MVRDRILFGMPEDPELFLAALAAVQDYGGQLEKRWRKGEWVLAFHSPNPQLDFLRPCFPEGSTFVDEWNPKRGDWDFVHQFDGCTAYEFSTATEKSAATMFGIFIGSGPETEFPDLSKLKPVEETIGVFVMDAFEGAEELFDLIELNYPEYTIGLGWSTVPGGEYELMAAHGMVIGPRSFETYIAGALGKRVVELYPTDRHMKWLSKWSGKYQMLYGDSYPVGMIWRAVEEVLSRWPMEKR